MTFATTAKPGHTERTTVPHVRCERCCRSQHSAWYPKYLPHRPSSSESACTQRYRGELRILRTPHCHQSAFLRLGLPKKTHWPRHLPRSIRTNGYERCTEPEVLFTAKRPLQDQPTATAVPLATGRPQPERTRPFHEVQRPALTGTATTASRRARHRKRLLLAPTCLSSRRP